MNNNMHQPMGAVNVPNQMMMMQASPVMAQQQMQAQVPNPAQQQQQQQQQAEKIDNISKVKSLLAPLRETLFLTLRAGAFSLQKNNLADNLKREAGAHPTHFDKNMEDFYSYCDQIELHLKTAIQCMQQLSSAQHYLPGAVNTVLVQENPGGPISYPTYLNTVRVHVQSAKDIHDTLISAAQNISQAD